MNWTKFYNMLQFKYMLFGKTSVILHNIIIIIIHSFYIALFSALEQTHCAHWHVILNE